MRSVEGVTLAEAQEDTREAEVVVNVTAVARWAISPVTAPSLVVVVVAAVVAVVVEITVLLVEEAAIKLGKLEF